MKHPILLAVVAAFMIPVMAQSAEKDGQGEGFTSVPWESYGLVLDEDTEAEINTVRFEQQRQRFVLTQKYIAKLPQEVQAEMAKDMAAIDDEGEAKIQNLLSPEERAMHAKLKAEHDEKAKLWKEFMEWRAAKKN